MVKKAHLRNINGIVLLDKPTGISSNGALIKVRNLFKAQKAGHTGSLDPEASGVLPICLGEATKFSSFFLEGNKRYLASAILGVRTTTCDKEGEIVSQCEVGDVASRLESVLESFKGDIVQVPPVYSAIKVQGKALYKYAREGVEVEIPSRRVTIFELNLLEKTQNTFKVEVYCSKGTYIRTLIADIGEALGVGAYVSDLRRSQVEGLPTDIISLSLLEEVAEICQKEGNYQKLDHLLYPLDLAVARLPTLNLPLNMARELSHGIRQDLGDFKVKTSFDNLVQVRFDGRFMGVCTVENNLLIPKRLLNLEHFFD